MAHSDLNDRILKNPKFAEMVKKRTGFAVTLSLVILVPYYTFMWLTSKMPALFTAVISEGSVITIGWPIAVFIVDSTSGEPTVNLTT